ncbi:MAG: restriction endonuclease [Candidatus Woesearchaeota archaeon]|jgi:hypothetical protein|nr:restriction endonuclease [Candidatus Woesearchaeota archaeon]
MNTFHFIDLSREEFESMVNDICRSILGMATISFSEGKDGGRDGIFHGIAKNFNGYEGKFVIQAKKTGKLNASCSDSNFIKIIDEEIPKIKSLVQEGNLDYYLMFTNRKLPGIGNQKLIDNIKEKTGVKEVYIMGLENLNSYMDDSLISRYNLNKYREPLRINPEDLKSLIYEFEKNTNHIVNPEFVNRIKAFDIEKKNEINNMSNDFYKEVILKSSNLRFDEIDLFLQDPINEEYNEMYKEVSSEFQEKIFTKLKNVKFFEENFDVLYDEILSKMPEIKKRSLIRLFLHYMYINCDIGKSPVMEEEKC